MPGLNWTSYTSNTTLDAGYYPTFPQLYNNAVAFFGSPPTQIASGTITTLQLDSGSSSFNPPFSTFSLGPTDYIAIQFSGYFVPNQTGNWTIHFGSGLAAPCDDFGVLFLGVPGSTITPASNYTSTSDSPNNTLPFMYNLYNTIGNGKTVALQAGQPYPILAYYAQGRYGYNFGLGFAFNGGSLITDFSAITATTPPPIPQPITCFKFDTQILTDRGYIPVQALKRGDCVKTLSQGFKAIDLIGKKVIHHAASHIRIKDQLYALSPEKYPDLFEKLVITGCHCLLVDEFVDDAQKQNAVTVNGDIYITENKYRLPACVDDRASVYDTAGDCVIYHFALENDDYYMNYGIYANGLLVETCSKRYLTECAEMEMI